MSDIKLPKTLSVSMSFHEDIERACAVLAEDERLGVLQLTPTDVLKMALNIGLKQIIGDEH